ncbi:Uncharacterised protein [Halioglobus japonicus]|nr:Uncharacterised protein [Halioglobus japonicus]
MSSCLREKYRGARLAEIATASTGGVAVKANRGVGMMEFMLALLIFSVGMMALLSAQLAGKKVVFEASQRSVATVLVRDILERIRANPGQLAAYKMSGIGDEANRLPRPDMDCGVVNCSAQQLAAFDLWQWEALLLGHAEQDAGGYVGGLLTPRACITGSDRAVAVTISWRGVLKVSPPSTAGCDINLGVNPGSGGEGQEREVPQRHQLTVSTYLAVP